MIQSSTDAEHIARAFPSPKDSRPARSLTYQCCGHIYRAVIGQPRRQCEGVSDPARRRKPAGREGRASGNTVLSIVATHAAVEVWSRETREWPNPSLVGHDAVLDIDYLDDPDAIAS
jgi:hypothetical protein